MEVLGLLLFVILLAVYLVPTMIAAAANKRKTGPIFLLNVFLGWTVLGWIGSLVWAVADQRATPPPEYEPADVSPRSSTSSGALTAQAEDPPAAQSPPSPGQQVHLTSNRIVRVGPEITAPST